MPLPLIVNLLTALALVVVVLTRLRLRGDKRVAGQSHTSSALLNVHSIAGLAAVATWTAFLITGAGDEKGDAQVGIFALALFWLTAVAGIMILARWLPGRGRHSSSDAGDSWSAGPALSVLAHLGVLAAVCFFTWAYTFSKV